MILSCQNITKSFVGKTILSNASFHIEDFEKAAIIGINGAGKTTLLKIIMGQMEADSGLVTIARDKTVGYLSQHQELSGTSSIYEELFSVKQHLTHMEEQIRAMEHEMKCVSGTELEALMDRYSNLTHHFELENGYAYKSEVTGVLKGLGFTEDEFDKKITALSGGQKTRIALGKLLLLNPDLIILDEPTNHLDMSSINWLETYLLNYKGAVIVVSHDRYFIDRIASKIIEIDATNVSSFQGNYSAYSEKKEMLRKARMNAYLNQQREIHHQEEVIEKLKSFNREKSIKRAESREKALDKIQVLEKPSEINSEMDLRLVPQIVSGKDVLAVSEIKKSFQNMTLFQDLSFEIKRGEHVAIIGKNGTGKTTLLKMINHLLEPDQGSVSLGANVHVGYYDQEHQVLHYESTLFEELSNEYPTLTNTQIRNTLAAFLFTGDDVYKRIRELSGGERGRVSLAKLMLSNANFLILDEPTNHLDIVSKEILESALNNYEGTVLYVSHDRYFVNKTATRILDLSDQKIINYIGNYDYYLEKIREQTMLSDTPSERTPSGTTSPESELKTDWQAQKELQAKKRKLENQIQKTEAQIGLLESRLESISEKINDPAIATNSVRLQELSTEQTNVQEELDQMYATWESLQEE